MCGIAGIISQDPRLVDETRLRRMADSLQHRGPSGEGYWTDGAGQVGFAHRRLCVIDLSDDARQPLHYLHYTIIFNGEIYNYRELRSELKSHGYVFFSQSDTEVIPAAFDCWGLSCLNKFDGMFAFALWNEKTGQLILARDRFGEKPLFYFADYRTRGKFQQLLFASEMKALWAAGVDRDLDGTMMLNYLTLGFVQNPIKKTQTFYSNIRSLAQGHYLVINPEEGRLQVHRWYDPAFSSGTGLTEEVAVEQFRELLTRSVTRRLRSDVGIGTSLSGGIDSSSIIAVIDGWTGDREEWRNAGFTAAFPGFEKDETRYSKLVAETFHIRQYLVEPKAADWIRYFKRLMYYQEEPVQSSSVLSQYLVYREAAAQGITVLLDGQGADEIMGGYKKYVHWYLQQLLRSDRLTFLKERRLLLANHMLEHWSWRNYAAAFFPDRVSGVLQKKAIQEQQRHSFIDTAFYAQYRNNDTLQKPLVKRLDDLLYYNTFHFGLPELLRYADRNSMAHSREVRLPFLYHELVEFVFSLPPSYKIRNGFTKWILRKSMEQRLPAAITWRKDKVGFEPPQKAWMAHKDIREMIIEARKKLVQHRVLRPAILETEVKPAGAHDADNFDWRYLCAAELFV